MYLESLMSLSRTPFSLVDEINQGMDQRNERAVHNLLVASTCKGTAGQFGWLDCGEDDADSIDAVLKP